MQLIGIHDSPCLRHVAMSMRLRDFFEFIGTPLE